MNYFQIILSLLALAVILYSTGRVYFRNPQSWTSHLVVLLGFFVCAYVISNPLATFSIIGNVTAQLFWIRVATAVCGLVGPTLFVLAYAFPDAELHMPKSYLIATILIAIAVLVLSLSPAVFTSLTYAQGIASPTPGPANVLWVFFAAAFVIAAMAVTVRKYLQAPLAEKPPQLLFLASMIITFTFTMTTVTFSYLLFHTTASFYLGPLSFVVLFICLSYILGRQGPAKEIPT